MRLQQNKTYLSFVLFLCLVTASWLFFASISPAEDEETTIDDVETKAKDNQPVSLNEETTLETVKETYPPLVKAKLQKVVASSVLKLFTPFNYALVRTPQVTLVGDMFDPLLKTVTIRVNGGSSTYPLKDSVFHVSVKLKEGENVIVLADEATLNVYFSPISQKIHRPLVKLDIPAGYVEYQFHSNLSYPECASCHRLGPEIAGLPDCYVKCHMGVLANSWAHGPTGEFRCLACHDPFGDQSGYSLILTGKELCLSCHVTMSLEKPFVHGAVQQGLCLGCHNPHSTPYMKVLRFKGSKLCYTCHEVKTKPQQFYKGETLFEGENENEYGFPHPPVEEGRCLFCHEPHESNHKNNLKKVPTFLCTIPDCHGTLEKSPLEGKAAAHFHPFDKDPAVSIMAVVPDDIKRDENKRVVCYSCHTPHGSNRDSFLIDDVGTMQRGKKLCGKCHPPVETIDGTEVELNIERDD